MGFGGSSGGGSGSISSSSDVALNNPTNSDVLTYDSSTSKWKNGAVIPAGVTIVKWTGSSWGSYSTDPNAVRFFLSQNDQTATAPTYYSEFDMWYAHPDAA